MLTILFSWSLLLPKLLSLPSSHHDLVNSSIQHSGSSSATGFSGVNVPMLGVVMSKEINQTEAVLKCSIEEYTFWSFLGKYLILFFFFSDKTN